MASPISQMVDDLEKVVVRHAAESLAQIRATASRMAAEAEKMSSPLYGSKVSANVSQVPSGAVVKVQVDKVPGAVGTVFGGEQTLMRSLGQRLDAVAGGAGLDRRQ